MASIPMMHITFSLYFEKMYKFLVLPCKEDFKEQPVAYRGAEGAGRQGALSKGAEIRKGDGKNGKLGKLLSDERVLLH